MIISTRFAPSPTGRLHLGHALAAKVAWRLARDNGGQFFLRHEDIDGSRVREEFYAWIEEDLGWLGFHWDGAAIRQSSRVASYEAALIALREMDLVYPCFCTRRVIQEEWGRMGEAPQGPEGPLYPGICRRLTAQERENGLSQGWPHAWRLNARKAGEQCGVLSFTDLRFGKQSVQPERLGDVVLARKDIGIAYHLAVVVDDAFQCITHVTRGEDLLASTHVHRLLQHLLKLPEPAYLHHRLVVDKEGKRLAKRDHATSIAELRSQGLSAEDVLALLPEE